MKKIILLGFMICGSIIEAQTHRFIYDVEYKKNSTQSVLTKENYLLDIDDVEAKYYTRDFFVADSLIANNIPFPKGQKLNTSTIITHKKSSDQYQEYDILENTVLNLESKENQNWKLSTDKKKVKEMTLQKATANWGGRNWTAWFSTEIPFQEGPYKFHGLPGLIVELYDDRNDYHFSLVKSQNINGTMKNQFIEMSKAMSVHVTREKYNATKLKYYQAPINFLRNQIGEGNGKGDFYLNDGTVITDKNSRETNEILRKTIKQYNNPIDLENAVKY